VDIKISNNEGGERKMKNRKEALCGVVLALGVVIGMFGGCLGGDKTQERAESKIQERAAQEQEFEWYVNEEFGYRIKYPTGWKINEKFNKEWFSAEKLWGTEGYIEKEMWVVAADCQPAESPEEEMESWISDQKESGAEVGEELILEKMEKIEIDGFPAAMAKYSCHLRVDEGFTGQALKEAEAKYGEEAIDRFTDIIVYKDGYHFSIGFNQIVPLEKSEREIQEWERLIEEEILSSFEFIK
jgi:hypothetical protein